MLRWAERADNFTHVQLQHVEALRLHAREALVHRGLGLRARHGARLRAPLGEELSVDCALAKQAHQVLGRAVVVGPIKGRKAGGRDGCHGVDGRGVRNLRAPAAGGLPQAVQDAAAALVAAEEH